MGKVGTPRAPDMMGFKSGWLKVIARDGKRHGAATWLCECVCGGKTVVMTRDLRNGARFSCGCSRKKRPKLEPVIGVDPTVKLLFREMNKQQAMLQDVSSRSGVTVSRLTKWRKAESIPNILDMRAALAAIGYEIKIVESEA